MADNIAINVDKVSKYFKLPHEKNSSIKGAVVNFWRRDRTFEKQQVLNDVSFSIKNGEFFGVVGRNGSGKSTLLKLLAGIYNPSKGSLQVNGKLTPFIELGVGFNPELTGRENVFLNGALLGFSRANMAAMYDDIVDFAELHRFMDQKLKNYSSGMQVRLAFSIAIRAQSDILLLDEVLAVGDAAFQKKCYDYFMELKRQGRTVILVTHDMGAIRQYCTRAMMIDNGKIVKEGDVEKVAQAYLALFSEENKTKQSKSEDDDRWGNGLQTTTRAKVKTTDEEIIITTEFTAHAHIESVMYGFTLYEKASKTNIFESNTKRLRLKMPPVVENEITTLEWRAPNILRNGEYAISSSTCDESTLTYYEWLNGADTFKISNKVETAGAVNPVVKLKVTSKKDDIKG
ncbi:MAG TPA: ABC transporter ATP-binding protein [Verrucomicrobiae bacterium]|nr:ABC transporter ATP-binding protein [Verrucomicrobiae bacterium]